MRQCALIAALMAVFLSPSPVQADLSGSEYVSLAKRATYCGIAYQILTAAGVELEPMEIIDEIEKDARLMGASASEVESVPEFFERGRRRAIKAGFVSRADLSEAERIETMGSAEYFGTDCRSKLINSLI